MRNVSDTNLINVSQGASAAFDATMDSIPRVLSNRTSMAKFLRDDADPYRSADLLQSEATVLH